MPHHPWLPGWFRRPARADLSSGHHLRPLRTADDGLPGLPASVAVLADDAVVYGLFDDEERAVLGVVTVTPGTPPHDAVVRWWLAPAATAPPLAEVLAAELPEWMAHDWPFAATTVVPV